MQNVPLPAISVNQPARRPCPRSPLKRAGLIAAAVLVLCATTGAAIGPDASRIDLIMYSLGGLLAVVMVVKIVIKLFVYLIQAVVALGVLGILYLLVRAIIDAIVG